MDDNPRKYPVNNGCPDIHQPFIDRRSGITVSGWPSDLEIGSLSETLCTRTRETREHVLYVAAMTVKLARMARVPECDIILIRNGALLHDLGKVGIPEDILLKPTSLTLNELQMVRNHPRYTYDLLFPLSYLRPYLTIPYSHHEKWDGSGYPQGLKGDRIPLAARLFAVVDVWDSLSSDQAYRKAWPQDKVVEYVQRQSGAHFDPYAVKLLLTAMSTRQVGSYAGKRELTLNRKKNIEV